MAEKKVWVKLFRLKVLFQIDPGNVFESVVLAKNEKQARQIVAKETGKMFWNSEDMAECREFSFDSSPQLISKSYFE